MKNNKGFTLIELIMVTIILGILAAVAVPRYMGTVNQAEAAAEKAVIDALRAAVENYATQEFIEKGRYDYPNNPFTLVDVDGYCGPCANSDGNSTMVDGSWKFVNATSDTSTKVITHQRRDNSLWYWEYSVADKSTGDSDDRGWNIGTNNLANGVQVDTDQQSTLSN